MNAHFFYNSGSTLTQELGYALAAGNEYLVSLTNNGFNIDEAATKIIFNFATGSNYFMEIAKLRAARMLWARIVEQYHPKNDCSAKMRIHSVTANWNKTIYDPYVNVLRSSTEAMSAALGGEDTQVAPPAVLISALRIGQSLMASEPSFILSVSRLGDATEPASR